MIKVGILGASGYTGYELVRLLRGHPQVEIAALGAHTNAGQTLADLFDGAATWQGLPKLRRSQTIDFGALDLVFCALPHGQAAQTVKDLMVLPNLRLIIDLSNDHRLTDYSAYQGMKGRHPYPEIATQAVYGLSEWHGNAIKAARLIANPGCYPTSILLPLLPLLKADLIDANSLIANSASGSSGAGRSAQLGQLHAEVSENFCAYGLGVHRHGLEIQEQIEAAAAVKPHRRLVFNPHLLPMNRGILTTLTLTTKAPLERLQSCLEAAYAAAPFVQVAEPGRPITTKSVRGTNLCRFSLHPSANADQVILTCAIDNLIKGASGQAIQNMNLALGLSEGLGLLGQSVLEP